MIAEVCANKIPVVVVVSLAPTGFPHARYLSKRLRNSAPDVQLIVGRWGDPASFQAERDALQKLGVNDTTDTLSSTINVLDGWRAIVESQPPVKVVSNPNKIPATIGTSSAL
jgi:hypothetical protein